MGEGKISEICNLKKKNGEGREELPFYCGWTASLVQTPREVLFFIIQSIKTMVAEVGPDPKSKN